MKKVLLASTALVLSAGVAAADMTLTGDGRMGVRQFFGNDEVAFISRFRAIFTGTGETDGGLAFGGTIRADNAGGFSVDDSNSDGDGVLDLGEINAGGGNEGFAGSVFISGDFGTLLMGDVDGAAEAAVGDVSGVGLTGLGDRNETTYVSNGNARARPSARYEYTFGDFGVFLSANNTAEFTLLEGVQSAPDVYSVGANYSSELFTVGLGWETAQDTVDNHIVVGGSVNFAGAVLSANYGNADGPVIDGDQWAVSIDYTFDATTLTAFYADGSDFQVGLDEETDPVTGVIVPVGSFNSEAWGIGASYDLGGGAALQGGYVSDETADEDSFDFGVSMTF